MSARAMLQHELKMVRDQRDGLQAALDASEAECQRLRERLAITDRARQLALADLTAAEMHLDAAGLSIPTLPRGGGVGGPHLPGEKYLYYKKTL